jgi:hypothetical protein
MRIQITTCWDLNNFNKIGRLDSSFRYRPISDGSVLDSKKPWIYAETLIRGFRHMGICKSGGVTSSSLA